MDVYIGPTNNYLTDYWLEMAGDFDSIFVALLMKVWRVKLTTILNCVESGFYRLNSDLALEDKIFERVTQINFYIASELSEFCVILVRI